MASTARTATVSLAAARYSLAPLPGICSRRALHSTRRAAAAAPLVLEPEGAARAPRYAHRHLAGSAGKSTVSIIPCPFNGGQGRAGVELGPNRLIDAGLSSQIASLGWTVRHDAAVAESFAQVPYHIPPAAGVTALPDPPIGGMKKPRLVSEVCRRVAMAVGDSAGRGELPLTLGGDHSLGMATHAGVKRHHPDAALIWVDAHADINTPETTDSGNLHGCPVSFLLGLQGTDVEPFNTWLKPCLTPKDIVFIGLRDVDPMEKQILRQLGIRCFTMHEVDRYGIGKVLEMALDHVGGAKERPLHLSFDVDALDPSVAPSTGTPVRGGLTFREGHYITEAVAETGNLVALDIMEVNPQLVDQMSAEQTVAIGCSLARAALGETLL